MIRDDLKQHPNAVHIKIYADRMELINPLKNISTQVAAQPEYAHPRLLIADYENANSVLKQLITQGQLNKFKQTMALVQVMERTEHGLTQVEKRIFQELAYESGFTAVIIYDEHGSAFQESSPLPKFHTISTAKGLMVIISIVLICLFLWQITNH